MILAGDEFGNTQFGNNNPYCQDNETSWLDWRMIEQNRELFLFFKQMIQLRKAHPILRDTTTPAKCGLPAISKHGISPWVFDDSPENRVIGVMFAGRNATDTDDEMAYLLINAHWVPHRIHLPELPAGFEWHVAVNTLAPAGKDCISCPENRRPVVYQIGIEARSVMILISARIE